jgi:hypothetical protein
MAAMMRIRVIVLFLGLLALTGCAFDLADVRFTPARFVKGQNEGERSFELSGDAPLRHAPCGYRRTLKKGTHWQLVGAIPQGEVFKSVDQVLTLECSNIFEAYLVVFEKRLVGFYLPVEKGFVAAAEPLYLPMKR